MGLWLGWLFYALDLVFVCPSSVAKHIMDNFSEGKKYWRIDISVCKYLLAWLICVKISFITHTIYIIRFFIDIVSDIFFLIWSIQNSTPDAISKSPVKQPSSVTPADYVPSSPAIDKRKFIPNPAFPLDLMDPAFCFSVVSYNILAECHWKRFVCFFALRHAFLNE